MKDKITRAGYLSSSAEEFAVTFDENEDPKTTGHKLDAANIQKRMEASTLVNINSQNSLKLGLNDTFRLRSFRAAWQIINTDTMNIMIEPDFNYEIISGAEHISMVPVTSKCTGNAGSGEDSNWMDITGVSEGTTVIEVSYDAIKVDGANTTFDGLYGATDPQRKSLIVINVGDTSENTLKLRAKGAERDWDTEFDTLYFTEETGTFEFSATLGESEVDKVEMSADNGKTWTAVNKKDGLYSAEGLVGGNNLLKFTKGDKVEYQVVRAAKVTYVIVNKNRDEGIIEGDTLSIQIKGLYVPIPKMSGIYNPGFQAPNHNIAYTLPEGVTSTATGGQYDFINNHKYEITLGTEGNYKLTNGSIFGTCMGDSMGSHRNLTDAGVGTNMSAGNNNGYKSSLPDLTFEVVKMPVIAVSLNIDTEGTTVKVTDESGAECTAENGVYNLEYGTYGYNISKDGYVTERGKFSVGPKDKSGKTVNIKMRKIEGEIWDGSTLTPASANEDGVYEISTGAQLAWFAQTQVKANQGSNAILTKDVSLGGFNWTPITAYKGTFDGNGHFVTDLYINAEANNQALFGDLRPGAVVKNLGVKGEVTTTKQRAAGIAAYSYGSTTAGVIIENCKSEVNVTTKRNGAAGILASQTAYDEVRNCYNTGNIVLDYSSSATACGIANPSMNNAKLILKNVYNTGKVSGTSTKSKLDPVTYLTGNYAVNVENAYALHSSCATATTSGTGVSSGELRLLAPELGDAYMENPTSYNDGYPILKWEEPYALPYAREEAATEIANYKSASDYREDEAKELAKAVDKAKSAIESADSLAAVAEEVKSAKETIDALKTDAEYTAEELAVAKEAAKSEIANYKDTKEYRDAQKDELAAIISEANDTIDAAADMEGIENVVTSVKASMDKVKTDAQLTKEENMSAVEKAEAAQKAAEEAQKAAEQALANAQIAEKEAKDAQEKAEASQAAAEAAKAEAEAAQKAAEEAIAAGIPVTEISGTAKSVSSVKLSWEKITGVNGYIILKAASAKGEYKEVKVINGNKTVSYTDNKLKCGTTYYYKVKAYRTIGEKTYVGEASDALKYKAKPAKAVIKKVYAKNNAAQLTWARQKDVSGYKIYRSTSKAGTYKLVKTIKSNKKLKDKKKYYYKVRAYRNVNGKAVYGYYSTVKSVKTK